MLCSNTTPSILQAYTASMIAAWQGFKFLRTCGFHIPSSKSDLNPEISINKRQCVERLVRKVFDDISHVFQLDPASVSNLDTLQHKGHFAGNICRNYESGFVCMSNICKIVNTDNQPPSVGDLRQDVVNRIEANHDPVKRVIHLNEYCTGMHAQAERKTYNTRTASERYAFYISSSLAWLILQLRWQVLAPAEETTSSSQGGSP